MDDKRLQQYDQIAERIQAETRARLLAACGLDEFVDRLVRLMAAKTTKFFANGGEVVEERDVDDNRTQLDAVKFYATVMALVENKLTVTHKDDVSDLTDREIDQEIERLGGSDA